VSRWSGSIFSNSTLTNLNVRSHLQTRSHFQNISRRATHLSTSLIAQMVFLTWAIHSKTLTRSRNGRNGIQRHKSREGRRRSISARRTGSGTILESLRPKQGHSIPRTQRSRGIIRRATSWIPSSLRLHRCQRLRSDPTQRRTLSNLLQSQCRLVRLISIRVNLPASRIVISLRRTT